MGEVKESTYDVDSTNSNGWMEGRMTNGSVFTRNNMAFTFHFMESL
jgi:hypothetical protein